MDDDYDLTFARLVNGDRIRAIRPADDVEHRHQRYRDRPLYRRGPDPRLTEDADLNLAEREARIREHERRVAADMERLGIGNDPRAGGGSSRRTDR